MYSIQEQFKTDALAQMSGRVRDAQAIAENILELSHKIGVLNLRTTQASAGQVAGAMQKLLGAGNPGEFLQIAASLMRPDMQLWTSYVEQLKSIAGKAGLPAMTSLAATASTVLAPQPMPDVTRPEAESGAAQQATPTAPVVEAPMEQALGQDVPPAEAPLAAAMEDSVDEAALDAAGTPAGTVEVAGSPAEAMTGGRKTPPLDEPVVAEITAARKSPAARSSRKAATKTASKKADPSVRSASGRARKG